MQMKLEQSFSANETSNSQSSSGQGKRIIDYVSTRGSEIDHLIVRNENDRNDIMDHNIRKLRLKNVTAASNDMDSEVDCQKLSKRKASPNEVVASTEKAFKMSSTSKISESLSVSARALTTPSPSNHVDDFLRQLRFRPKTEVKKDYFAALPDEVILIILRNCSKPTLVNCACVCRRWKNIALDNDLWTRINLSQRKILPGVMTHVLSKKPIILQMSQTEVSTPIFTNTFTNNSMSNFSNKIEYLDLGMAAIILHDLEQLLKTCRSLIKLSLENCEVNEDVCREIGQNFKLTVLNLSQCIGLNDIGLKSFLKNCKNLVELNIAWTSLNATAIKSISQFLPKHILKVNFSGCVKEMTDAHVSALTVRCNKLRELDLSDATGITGISVNAICENLKSLETLSLSRCYNIHPSNYSKLSALPFLRHLNIFGLFSEAQIEQLRKSYRIGINQVKFSNVARPTVGDQRNSIWGMSFIN